MAKKQKEQIERMAGSIPHPGRRIALEIVTLLLFILFMLPFVIVLLNSMRTNAEIINSPVGLPENPGNLWTNILLSDFRKRFAMGDLVHTVISHRNEIVFDERIPYYDSFGKALKHSVMIYNNEINKMGLAEVMGSLCEDYRLGYGEAYKVVFYNE